MGLKVSDPYDNSLLAEVMNILQIGVIVSAIPNSQHLKGDILFRGRSFFYNLTNGADYNYSFIKERRFKVRLLKYGEILEIT